MKRDIAAYTYDAVGQLLTAANNTGTVTFTYDNRGRVLSETNVWGKVVTYGYDARGNRTLMEVDTGVQIEYVYDSLNRMIQQRQLPVMLGGHENDVTYTYDNAGRLNGRVIRHKPLNN